MGNQILNVIFLGFFVFYFNLQSFSQDTLKSEGFLIVDFDSFYFLPIKSSFAKKNSIDFKDFKFKKGFNLSLTYDYFDTLTKSKGVKYLVHPSVDDEKYKYIYVLPCNLTFKEKRNIYKPTLFKTKYDIGKKIKVKYLYNAFYYSIQVELIKWNIISV